MPHDATGNRPRARLRVGRDGDGADCGRWAMMPTETLRAMLDERGVEWDEYGDGYTLLRHGGREYTVQPNVCNRLIVTNLTPEQAIAATLGHGTCHDVGTFKSWGLFTCSNCSVVFPLNAIREAPSVGKVLPPRFCPNCGRKVVAE